MVKPSKGWAQKYRPQRLSEVAGQDSIVTMFRGMLKKGSIPTEAFLLSGPSGCGKTTMARLIAKYLNCVTWNACGKCGSCIAFEENRHPDIEEMNMADSRKIEDVRNLIMRSQFMPTHRIKVYILDEFHQVIQQAEQCLLKPLEDPPPHVLWILGTTNPEKLASAIKGRCNHLPIKPLGETNIVWRLKRIAKQENIGYLSDKHYKLISDLSGGQMRDAISILENVSNYITGLGKECDSSKLSEIVTNQAIQTVESELDMVASAILIGIYRRNAKLICQELAKGIEPTMLMKKLMDLNQYLLDRGTLSFNSQGRHPAVFHSSSNIRIYKHLLTKGLNPEENLNLIIRVHNLILDTRAELLSFTHPDRSILSARLGRMDGVHQSRKAK